MNFGQASGVQIAACSVERLGAEVSSLARQARSLSACREACEGIA